MENKKIKVINMSDLVNRLESKELCSHYNLPLVAKVNGEIYQLTVQRYITDNDWNICAYCEDLEDINDNGLTVKEFIQSIEEEAQDESWGTDIRIAPFDACTSGNLFIALDMDGMEDYTNNVIEIEVLDDMLVFNTKEV